MPFFVIYLLKLSISLTAVWLFYQVVLRRLTFYSCNRWYLLGYAALAFFMPMVNVARIVENGHPGSTAILRYIPVIIDPRNSQINMPAPVTVPGYFSGLNSWDLLLAVLMLGSAILLIRLAVRWISLSRLRRLAVPIGNFATESIRIGDTRIGGGGVKIYQIEGKIVPFSFGDAIYVNRQQHTEKEWEEIILHEYVHIRQRHTIDILLAELLCILNWYNPFAWLIRHSIRQNLEFIADNMVLENGHDKKGYQYHLLKVVGASRYRLANNFNFSSLKKRIIMMNKIKSARLQLVKFLFVLPLAGVLLVAFRNVHEDMRANVAPSARKIANVAPLTRAALLRYAASLTSLARSPARIRDSMPPGPDAGKPNPGKPDAVRSAPLGLQPVMRPHPDSLHQPLIFIDGVESVNNGPTWQNPLNKINPFDIQSIDVLGPDSARKVYGEKGKNGVVFVRLKKMIGGSGKDTMVTDVYVDKDKAKISVSHPGKDTISAAADRLTINHEDPGQNTGQPKRSSLRVADSFKGLILLDGKEISKQVLFSLDDSKIKTYDILAGNEAAVKQYGEKARDGVIVVVSK